MNGGRREDKFLLTAFFAYRLVLSVDFIPSGLMGILGLVALVLYCALPAKENCDIRQPIFMGLF